MQPSFPTRRSPELDALQRVYGAPRGLEGGDRRAELEEGQSVAIDLRQRELIGTDILRRDDRAERFDGARTAHEAARLRQFPAAARDRARAVGRQHRRPHAAGALIDGHIVAAYGRPKGPHGLAIDTGSTWFWEGVCQSD